VKAVPVIDFEPGQPPGHLTAEIDRWVSSDPITELVGAFGGADITASDDLTVRLDKLAAFSDRWDFRRGEERNLAQTRDFADSHSTLISDASRALGLVDSRPPRFRRYDHMVILGGLIRACLLRPRLAATLLAEGLAVKTVTAIGAFRPLAGDEPALAAAAGVPDVSTEHEAMVAGMRWAFALVEAATRIGEDVKDNPYLSWQLLDFGNYSGPRIRVVVAPTTDPQRRANTSDSYKYLAEQLAHLHPGGRVLAVTSAIYIPFQHADAIRMLGLPYQAHVDTVGVDTTTVREDYLRRTFAPSQYLQEVRSALLSLRNLHRAAMGVP